MKIKKTILTAMIVGMTIGVTATACEKVNIQEDLKTANHSDENCDDTPKVVGEQYPMPIDCGLCGIG